MRKTLVQKAASLGIAISGEQAEKFSAFHEFLTLKNARMNLTRVPDDMQEAIDRNYLDSVSPIALGVFDGVKTLVDVGSGAGFPGIPLAILLPDVEITLLDALGKRVDFLNEAIKLLSLRARAVKLRAEEAGARAEMREAFDCAVSRAVAGVNVLAEYMLPLVRVGGRMLAYKGPAAQEELVLAENAVHLLGGRAVSVRPVLIPGRDWAHSVVEIEKIAPTPAKYPRRAGMPEKRPLG